jgi:hypothetical protein
MVRIVEQQAEIGALATLSNTLDQARIIPFMYDNNIRTIHCCIDVEIIDTVKPAVQLRIGSMKPFQRPVSFLLAKPSQAPTIRGLIDFNAVSEIEELGHDTP